jgi:hypothetical protein
MQTVFIIINKLILRTFISVRTYESSSVCKYVSSRADGRIRLPEARKVADPTNPGTEPCKKSLFMIVCG